MECLYTGSYQPLGVWEDVKSPALQAFCGGSKRARAAVSDRAQALQSRPRPAGTDWNGEAGGQRPERACILLDVHHL